MSRRNKQTGTYEYKHLKKNFPRLLKNQVQSIAIKLEPFSIFRYLKSNGFSVEFEKIVNNNYIWRFKRIDIAVLLCTDLEDGGFTGKYTIQRTANRRLS